VRKSSRTVAKLEEKIRMHETVVWIGIRRGKKQIELGYMKEEKHTAILGT
jgi:hypothetical protein